MKNIDDFIFYNKWISYVAIGFLGPLVAGITQWLNSGEWPPLINWIGICAGCLIGLFTQNLAFLSSANSERKKKEELNGNIVKPPTP
jgi:drug/metabolite transporter (DMT)-like permease